MLVVYPSQKAQLSETKAIRGNKSKKIKQTFGTRNHQVFCDIKGEYGAVMSSGSIGTSQRRWFPNGGTERQHATTAHKILCHYFHTTIDLTTHEHIREWRQNYLYRKQNQKPLQRNSSFWRPISWTGRGISLYDKCFVRPHNSILKTKRVRSSRNRWLKDKEN